MFTIECPVCGEHRNYTEFRFGGEVNPRPDGSDVRAWQHYLYVRRNNAGPQIEWWYHRAGCQTWFLAERDTTSNTVLRTWPPDRSGEAVQR